MNQIISAFKFMRYRKRCWQHASQFYQSSQFFPLQHFEDHMVSARTAFEGGIPALRFSMENFLDDSESSMLHPEQERIVSRTEHRPVLTH